MANLPAFLQFRRALATPASTQWRLLRTTLAQNVDSAYGRTHRFDQIRTYEEFARRVPLVDYDDLEPSIERIKLGEPSILTTEPVTHLIPTSGSSGMRKLIPFTAGVQRQFNRAIAPWIVDLARRHPAVLFGPAYWSITPAMQPRHDLSVVPIGFADDAAYLAGFKRWLVRMAVIAPQDLGSVTDLEEFRYQTLLCLLRQRELRLISIWHPSFLTLLLDSLPSQYPRLLTEIGATHPVRAAELQRAEVHDPQTLWPCLQVISCWGGGAAEMPMADLRRRFPAVSVQPKGLLATEAFVTIPFAGMHPVAVSSHFFEFVDDHGRVRLLDQLRAGETYEVVVTTAGGLWRYRLRDRVQVTGFVASTPSLRFLGKTGNICDLCGEKLTEAFVAEAVHETLAICKAAPRFALVAPDGDATGSRYTFYVEDASLHGLAETLDTRLRQNPNYAYCRALGQLLPVRLFAISTRGYETFVTRQMTQGMRLGDVKPTALSHLSGWSELFSGAYTRASAFDHSLTT